MKQRGPELENAREKEKRRVRGKGERGGVGVKI